MAEETGPAAFLRQETALLRRTNMRPLLPGIRCPTLIVVGDADLITPRPVAEEMATLVPGATLEVLQRCGHLSTLERPEETTLLLRRWLLA